MRSDLPTGTVTFLFTDVEGSTSLLRELGAEAYADALAEHRRIVREVCAAEGGVEVDTQGDAFFVAFPSAPGAAAAAQAMTDALADGQIHLRIGLHTGTPLVTDEGYVGDDVHLAARVAASGHGGQVLFSKSARELVDGLSLTDLGEHRLKDIEGAVSIYQLGEKTFPPLKTISNTNLPRPASSFIGRERERDDVVRELRDGARLLTLTGPGGSGKTRLALEAAAELVPSFKAGVFWIGLAALREPSLVSQTIAHTLGARDGLAEYIGEREMLLLLDNLEQVIEAAPDLSGLVQSCPNLALLVTSRELLRVHGEVEYAVPPLVSSEAVSLFCERSRLEATAEIAELCLRLDDLPLAVELAAARTRALSPAQILERLSQRLDLLKGGRDAEARQQTLRATIAWSYDLLSDEEQRLFRALSVFAGGCTVDAAEEVAGADLDTLQSLVEKSLLRFTSERYWMLETIREYAGERLQASLEAEELRRQHAEWYLRLAEEAFPNLLGTPGEWLDRLEAEHDNFRAALAHLEGSGDVQSALQLAGALYRFWAMRGHLGEGGRRLIGLLGADDDKPTPVRGRALCGAAAMAMHTGDTATLRARAEEALSLHRQLGDKWGVAYAQMMLGNAAAAEGDNAAGLSLYEEAARSFRELGDQHYSVALLNSIAHFHGELGDRERERAIHEETLRLARLHGNERVTARALYSLSWFALNDGRPQDSKVLVEEALATYLRLGEVAQVSMGVRRFGWAVAAEGGAHSAAQLLARAEALREEIGDSLEAWILEMDEKTLTAIRDQLADAAFDEAWEQGKQLTLDEAIELALSPIDSRNTPDEQAPTG